MSSNGWPTRGSLTGLLAISALPALQGLADEVVHPSRMRPLCASGAALDRRTLLLCGGRREQHDPTPSRTWRARRSPALVLQAPRSREVSFSVHAHARGPPRISMAASALPPLV